MEEKLNSLVEDIFNNEYDSKELFKCRNCGEKHNITFCATNDISLCCWCSGEEK